MDGGTYNQPTTRPGEHMSKDESRFCRCFWWFWDSTGSIQQMASQMFTMTKLGGRSVKDQQKLISAGVLAALTSEVRTPVPVWAGEEEPAAPTTPPPGGRHLVPWERRID